MIFRKTSFFRQLILILTLLAAVMASAEVYAATEILNVRHWTAPDHTRIVLDVDGEPDYDFKEGDHLLIVNFRRSSLGSAIPSQMMINKPGIKKINFYSLDDDIILAKFMLAKHQRIEVFKLKKFQDKPDRVVIDISLEPIVPEEKITERIPELRKKKVIVIDPGHGGEDPGAVGKNGTYEKNIVLAISRELKKAINAMPGYRAVLTREGDYYVSFKNRLQKAKKLGASLFISVHADAERSRSARGASVYCLSTGAASNEAAKLLARNENLADILGGVPDSEGNNDSNQILMNMFQTDTMNVSKIYAGALMKQLDLVNGLKFETVQEAPFRVLKLPDIPAVLIETAFISNSQEERLLKKHSFQKDLATAIASSIKNYFGESDKEPQSNTKIATTKYTIKRGDTLLIIANNFQTKVGVLLELNDMKLDDIVWVGQKINVPAGKSDDKIATTKYTIKRGDTLLTIANDFQTKVGVLLELNDMKLDDIVLVGQKINVPADKDDPLKTQKKAFKFYTVREGENLFLIAKKNSTTLAELLKINEMEINDPLLYGSRIKIPLNNARN